MNVPQAHALVRMGKSLNVDVQWTLIGSDAMVVIRTVYYFGFDRAYEEIKKLSRRVVKTVSSNQYLMSCVPQWLMILSPKVQMKIQLSQN